MMRIQVDQLNYFLKTMPSYTGIPTINKNYSGLPSSPPMQSIIVKKPDGTLTGYTPPLPEPTPSNRSSRRTPSEIIGIPNIDKNYSGLPEPEPTPTPEIKIRTLPNTQSKSIYDSNLNANVISTFNGRGTSIITPLNTEQQNRIDTNTGVSKDLFGNTKSGNILTANLNDIRRNINQVESSTNKINELNKDLDNLSKDNTGNYYSRSLEPKNPVTKVWTGSEESYKNYQDKLSEFNSESFKLDNTQKTIGVGLGSQKQLPITDFRYLKASNPISQLTSVIPVVSETIGATGETFGSRLAESLTPSNKEYKIKTSLPFQSGGTSFNSGSGYFAPTTEVTVTENYNKKSNAAIGGAIGNFGGRLIPYLNPIGGYIFGAEEAGKLSSEVEFASGKVGKGVVNYVTNYPFEAGGLVLGGVILGASKASTTLKLNKFGKYIKEVEETRVLKPNREIVNKYNEPNIKRPALTTIWTDGGIKNKVTPKTKGTTSVTEIYPSNDLTGISIETRKTGLFKRSKEFKGEVSLIDGNFKQTVDYGKYKKVIELNPEGKGSITLFDKNNNVKFSRKIKSSKEPSFTDTTTLEGINIEPPQINNAGLTTLQVGKEKIVTKDGNRVIDLFGNNNPDLTATSIKFKGNTDITTSVAESGKYAQLKADTYFFSEEVTASERSGQAFFAENGKKANIQKKVGQTIERGENKDVDTVLRMQGRTREATILNTAPKVATKVAEGSGTKIIQFINPKGTLNKQSLSPAFKKMSKEFENALKQKAKPIVKKIKELKTKELNLGTTEPARPLIVGGEGGEKAKSVGFNIDLSMSSTVYVPETSNYLRGSNPVNVNLPEGFNVVKTNLPNIEFGFKPRARLTQESIKVDTIGANKFETKSNFVMGEKTNTSLGIKTNTSTDTALSTNQVDLTNLGSKDNQDTKSRQDTKSSQEQVSNQDVVQIFKQQQETKLIEQPKQRELTRTKTKIGDGYEFKNKLKIFPKIPLLGKLSNAVDRTPDLFKVYARSKGKDVLISKETSLEGAKKTLETSLSKTLRASGLIIKNGKKLKVSQLGNIGTNFGTSKKDDFRLIERKNKRLKKGTSENKEISGFTNRRRSKSKFF